MTDKEHTMATNRLRVLAGLLALVGLSCLMTVQPRSTEAPFADAEVGAVSVSASALPEMSALSCTGTGVLGLTGARISWTTPGGLPAGAEYRMRVTISGKTPVDVYLPQTATSYAFDATLGGALASLLTVTLATSFTVELTPVLRNGQTVVWAGQSRSRTARALLNLVFNCA